MFKTIWKKLAASLMLTALVSTVAFAAAPISEPVPDNLDFITDFDVSPNTFNPTTGDRATISFDLAERANLYIYAENTSNFDQYTILGTAQNQVTTSAGNNLSYTWTGRTQNNNTANFVPEGSYTIKAFAFANGLVYGFREETVTVTGTGNGGGGNNNRPDITSLTVNPSTFSARDGEDTDISFVVDEDADVTIQIRRNNETVRSFTETFYRANRTNTVSWDGEDNDDDDVAEGTYQVVVTAENNNGNDTETVNVEVDDDNAPVQGTIIRDFTLDPETTWDPTDEELQIEFELIEDVDNLIIEARKDGEIVEILDEDDADEDEYEEEWDGTDDDGDFVEEGRWEIMIRADGDRVARFIDVDYEDPQITEAFLTKDEFDPDQDEFTHLVFKVDADAVVTVEVMDGSRREVELLDEEEVDKNRWVAVKWDGTDDDGDEVDSDGDWSFRITAESETDDDISDTETVDVDVEEDDASDRAANVTNDFTVPVIFDEDDDSEIEFSYEMDDDADVTLAIHKGKSASGRTEIELLDEVEQDSGDHSIKWNVRDEDGKKLKDGIYSYKITSESDNGRKDTEVGRFVVGDMSGEVDLDDDDDDDNGSGGGTDGDECGGFSDTLYLGDEEMCRAIAWAKSEGIFQGFADGRFGLHEYITRAEVLKVTLEAFDVTILPEDGTNQGFSDVSSNAWYMSYIRTGRFHGMVHGYPDGSFRPNNNINRVEFLKFALEAAEDFTGFNIPNYNSVGYDDVNSNDPRQFWFIDYAGVAYDYRLLGENFDARRNDLNLEVGSLIQRGEVALMLYRMHLAGLLDGSADQVSNNFSQFSVNRIPR